MGDGPAYDHMYSEIAKVATHKHATQKRRVDMLHKLLMEVGFGESDGDLTRLEKMAVRKLNEAYDLFSMLARDK